MINTIDISDTAIGKRVHAIMAWTYATLLTQQPPTMIPEKFQDYAVALQHRVAHTYQRSSLVLACTNAPHLYQQKPQDLSDLAELSESYWTIMATLSGTPFLAWAEVYGWHSSVTAIESPRAFAGLGPSYYGWAIRVSSAYQSLALFYDPSSQCVWPWGDRTPTTSVWHLPTMQELSGIE